tara:strand:+ start:28 stop:252 length:225 start_codon:yes stop_codon:yes gene_type:complete
MICTPSQVELPKKFISTLFLILGKTEITKKRKNIRKLRNILYLNFINIVEKNINKINNGWLYALHVNTKIEAVI